MIIFNVIRWQNLLSTGNVWTEVQLDKARTTLIIGSNGAGKSTILDAISFVLFNKPFRKVNKGQLINSITNKNLVVEVEFTKGNSRWMVRRGSKPNIFEIHQDGELIDQNAENKDYQSFLETVVGMNQKAFTQIVILGAASFVPFMQLSVPVRREVIEDFMDIQVFSDMGKHLKGRIGTNASQLMFIEHGLDTIKNKIKWVEESNSKQTEGNQTLIDSKNSRMEQIVQKAMETVEKLEAEKTKRDGIKVDTKQVGEFNAQKRLLEDELLTIKNEIKSHEKTVLFLNSNDTCPTCNEPLRSKQSQLEENETRIAILAQQGHEKVDSLSEINVLLSEIFEIEKRIQKHDVRIIEFERELEDARHWVETITNEITELKATNKKVLTDVGPLKKELEEETIKYDQYMETKRVMDEAARLLKDDGIKAVIIKKYIPVVNSLINKYLAEMDFFVDFQINEAFEETIKSRFRDEFSYESFSEGEKMRIDLAILFAWREVAKKRNSAATNLLIFDEVLDSSLDPAGVEEFIRIIKAMTDNENIFVISHRGDTIGDKFDDVLKFSRVQGFSKLEHV